MKFSLPKRQVFALLISILVSVVALFATFRGVDFNSFWAQTTKVKMGVFLLSYLSAGLGFLCIALRIKILVGTQHPFSFKDALRSVFAGYLGNAVLPARIGEFLKAGYISFRTGLSPGLSIALIAVERVIDLALVIAFSLWVLPLALGSGALGPGVWLAVAIAAAGCCVLVVATFQSMLFMKVVRYVLSFLGAKLERLILPIAQQVLDGLGALKKKKDAFYVILLSVFYWLFSLVTLHVWTLAFDLEVPWYASFLLLAFLAVGTALPAAAAYVGTYHFAVVAALSVMDTPKSRAAAVAVFVHAAGMIPWVILGALLVGPTVLSRSTKRIADKPSDKGDII
ncbi:MAG: flippase-like domain-containing protein [Myxococcales bacterium]|nr:MAG: flippase-like domain-containing protein [Myxococcales bacterium]